MDIETGGHDGTAMMALPALPCRQEAAGSPQCTLSTLSNWFDSQSLVHSSVHSNVFQNAKILEKK